MDNYYNSLTSRKLWRHLRHRLDVTDVSSDDCLVHHRRTVVFENLSYLRLLVRHHIRFKLDLLRTQRQFTRYLRLHSYVAIRHVNRYGDVIMCDILTYTNIRVKSSFACSSSWAKVYLAWSDEGLPGVEWWRFTWRGVLKMGYGLPGVEWWRFSWRWVLKVYLVWSAEGLPGVEWWRFAKFYQAWSDEDGLRFTWRGVMKVC